MITDQLIQTQVQGRDPRFKKIHWQVHRSYVNDSCSIPQDEQVTGRNM
jgi:hypothetical protein